MNEMTCERFRELAPELALDVLSGDERAPMIAHLERCHACGDHLGQLTAVGDGLLSLVSDLEPPSGFETRVLQRLRPAMAARRRRRNLLAVAAAVVIAAGAGLGGWTVGALATREPPPPPVAMQQHLLRGTFIAAGREAGQVFVSAGTPSLIYMVVHTDQHVETVACQLERSDGSLVAVGRFALNHGYGYWGTPIDLGPANITGARLIAADGSVLATANLTR
jgi:anti-sigma factor RsiW